jgi:hypothetical protein
LGKEVAEMQENKSGRSILQASTQREAGRRRCGACFLQISGENLRMTPIGCRGSLAHRTDVNRRNENI